jgi:hypothetical protein
MYDDFECILESVWLFFYLLKFFFSFTGSNLQVPKIAWQTFWEVMSFQESQQGPLFANSMAETTLESPVILP